MASFIQGDYKYTTLGSADVKVEVVDPNKASYDPIPSIVTDGVNTYSVTSVNYCFTNCTSLTITPTIPNSVTSMDSCFYNCTSLTTALVIPNSVTSVNYCFTNCTSLTQAPVIPNTVTEMYYCFGNCTSLIQPPVISDTVRYMGSCFRGCTSLTQAPVIPDSVTDMRECFLGCTSLTQAPVIPSSVTDMSYCFDGCTSLTGDVYVLRNNSSFTCSGAFTGTIKTIYLHAYYNGEKMAATSSYGNISADNVVNPTILNTQFVESGTYRVDMLLDGHAGSITSMIPNGTLYDMDDNEIEFGVGNNNPINYSRCYAIIQTTNRVPSTNINITIMNVAPSSKYIPVSTSVPSTATPSQIKQEGEANPISPTIDVTNVRFNPETTGLNEYTVGDVIGVTTTNMTKSQTNVDNDVKHIVTHAGNVRINDTTTLQDWITEQYNNLT